MKLKIQELSSELGLSEDIIEAVYKSYWRANKELIEQIPLKNDYTQEEFSQLRTSFNLPSIGKLYCDYDAYIKTKNKYNYNENKKDKTNV